MDTMEHTVTFAARDLRPGMVIALDCGPSEVTSRPVFDYGTGTWDFIVLPDNGLTERYIRSQPLTAYTLAD